MITGRPLSGVTTRESLERVAQHRRLPGVPAPAGGGTRPRPLPGHRRGHLHRGRARPARARGVRRPDGPGVHAAAACRRRHRLTLFTGQMPHGQGHQTTLAQIAADEFGVPFEQVRVVVGDSDVVPFGLTGGSRSATMTGGVHAARRPAAARPRCSMSRRSSSKPAPATWRSPTARSSSAATPTARSRSARSPGRPRRASLGDDVDPELEVEAIVRRRRRRMVGRQPLRHRRGRRRRPASSRSSGTSPPRTAARSSTPRSSRARSEAGSLRASAPCCSSGRPTTRTATTCPPPSWTTCCRRPARFPGSRSSTLRPCRSTPTSTSAASARAA